MGVFKEEAYVFERVIKNSIPIYSDACDVGIPVTGKDDPEVKYVMNALKHCQKLIVNRDEVGGKNLSFHGVTVVVEIAWEIDEGFECGTRYEISFHRDKAIKRLHPGKTAFISVDCKPYRKPYNRRGYVH